VADLPPDADADEAPGPPRWVLAFGTVAAVLVVVFVLVHLAGGGFRGHLHG
jgi:hypothetical protein